MNTISQNYLAPDIVLTSRELPTFQGSVPDFSSSAPFPRSEARANQGEEDFSKRWSRTVSQFNDEFIQFQSNLKDNVLQARRHAERLLRLIQGLRRMAEHEDFNAEDLFRGLADLERAIQGWLDGREGTHAIFDIETDFARPSQPDSDNDPYRSEVGGKGGEYPRFDGIPVRNIIRTLQSKRPSAKTFQDIRDIVDEMEETASHGAFSFPQGLWQLFAYGPALRRVTGRGVGAKYDWLVIKGYLGLPELAVLRKKAGSRFTEAEKRFARYILEVSLGGIMLDENASAQQLETASRNYVRQGLLYLRASQWEDWINFFGSVFESNIEEYLTDIFDKDREQQELPRLRTLLHILFEAVDAELSPYPTEKGEWERVKMSLERLPQYRFIQGEMTYAEMKAREGQYLRWLIRASESAEAIREDSSVRRELFARVNRAIEDSLAAKPDFTLDDDQTTELLRAYTLGEDIFDQFFDEELQELLIHAVSLPGDKGAHPLRVAEDFKRDGLDPIAMVLVRYEAVRDLLLGQQEEKLDKILHWLGQHSELAVYVYYAILSELIWEDPSETQEVRSAVEGRASEFNFNPEGMALLQQIDGNKKFARLYTRLEELSQKKRSEVRGEETTPHGVIKRATRKYAAGTWLLFQRLRRLEGKNALEAIRLIRDLLIQFVLEQGAFAKQVRRLDFAQNIDRGSARSEVREVNPLEVRGSPLEENADESHVSPGPIFQHPTSSIELSSIRSEARQMRADLKGMLDLSALIGQEKLDGQKIETLTDSMQRLRSKGAKLDEIFNQDQFMAFRRSELRQIHSKLRDRIATGLVDSSEEATAYALHQIMKHGFLDGLRRAGIPIATIGHVPFSSMFRSGMRRTTLRIHKMLSREKSYSPPQPALELHREPIPLPSEHAQEVAKTVFTKLQDLEEPHTLRIDFNTFGLDPASQEDELLLTDFLESQIRLLDSFKHLDIEVVGLKLAQVDDLRRHSNSVRNETVRTIAENADLDQRMRFRPAYLTPHPAVTVTEHVSEIHDMTTIFDPTHSHRGTRTVKFRGTRPDTIQPSSIVLLGAALITEETVDALEKIDEHHFILGSDLAFAKEVAFALDLLLRHAETAKELQHAA